MNIEQYRALKAQELAEANQPEETVKEEPIVEEAKLEEETIEETTIEEEPTKIEIDGQELSLDELKNGYLRQSDYTKKTQDLSRQRKEAEEALNFYESLKANPEKLDEIRGNNQVPDGLDPASARVRELENKVYDMMLEKEIDTLTTKYPDFDIRVVLETAQSKGIVDLEDAYLLSKPHTHKTTDDSDAMKEAIRKEVLAEIEKERNDTATIISSQVDTKPVTPKEAEISSGELKVAQGMGLTKEEYIKWRDVK